MEYTVNNEILGFGYILLVYVIRNIVILLNINFRNLDIIKELKNEYIGYGMGKMLV